MQLLFILLTMILVSFGTRAECNRNECKFTFDIADAKDCLEAYKEGEFKRSFKANNRDMSLFYYDGYLYMFHVQITQVSINAPKFSLTFCEKSDID